MGGMLKPVLCTGGKVYLLDQTKLPSETVYVNIANAAETRGWGWPRSARALGNAASTRTRRSTVAG